MSVDRSPDDVGNRMSLADNLASQGLTTYTYDAAFRLTQVKRSYGGTNGPRVDYGYDAADRLTSQSRTIGGSGTAVATTYSYDAANRLTTMTHQVAGGSVLATYVYGYDDADRVTSEQNAEGTVNYGYDATDQLTSASGSRSESYSYDSGGNRTMTGYAHDTGNRLTSGAGYTYAYDAEGNLTSKTQTSGGTAYTTYSYDYHNRLTGATVRASSGGSITAQTTYTYDALGRRIGFKVDDDGAGSNPAVQTWTVYDGDNGYADFDGSGTLLVRYLHGPAIDALLARTSSGGMTAWYLTDRLGTIRDIANTSGTVIDHVVYDSFGQVQSETSPSNGDRHKFTGREYDSAIGLYYFRARFYDPLAGRFVSLDPIRFDGGDWNIYRYVANAPINFTDPSGLMPDDGNGSSGYSARWEMEYKQIMRDRVAHLFNLMVKMKAIGDELYKKYDGKVPPLSRRGGDANVKFPERYKELANLMEYSINNYRNRYDYFRPVPFTSLNPLILLFPIGLYDKEFYGPSHQGVALLIHEPNHDIWAQGPGHSWAEGLLPLETDTGSNAFGQLMDYLAETNPDLWRRLQNAANSDPGDRSPIVY